MARLHLLSKSINANGLERGIARFLAPDDQLLFIGDSVNALLQISVQQVLKSLTGPVFALQADISCRGLASKMPAYIQVIDDVQMVGLTIENEQVISW